MDIRTIAMIKIRGCQTCDPYPRQARMIFPTFWPHKNYGRGGRNVWASFARWEYDQTDLLYTCIFDGRCSAVREIRGRMSKKKERNFYSKA